MKTILLSLILAVIAAVSYFPVAFLFGVATVSGSQDGLTVIDVIAKIFMVLIAQPIIVVPGVLIAGLFNVGRRLVTSK